MTDDDFDQVSERGSWRSRAVAAALAAAFLAGLAWLVLSFVGGEQQRPTGPQQIAVIRQLPPPPPPPPPKPQERPPEPPKVRDEVKVDEPKPDEPKPDEPKPADDKPASDKPLGLDADGTAGSDGFGLAANRGGRDLLGTGSGSGTVGGQGRYYTGLIQRNFFEALARSRQLPNQEFSVIVTIWLGDDGRVRRSEIVTSSGNAQIDQVVQTTLAEMGALRELPPPNLRQVQLRLARRA